MKQIYTEVEIKAGIKKIWQILMDKDKWLSWNTLIYDLDSTSPFKLGESIHIGVSFEKGSSIKKFSPIIMEIKENGSLKWMGSKIGFKGEHCFEFEEISDDLTLFKHYENFSGFLSPLFLWLYEDKVKQGFVRMNGELKSFAEK